ncbi:MAG: alpha/beta fold hydrolase [Bacteroidetes bacterium]|nr:alpha/beta fold hydrolase [Bacteroidota bacterium]
MKKVFVGLFVFSLSAAAQNIPRKAIMGALIKPVSGGVIVDSVVPNSTFDALHIQKGDIINSINNTAVTSAESYSKSIATIRAEDKVVVTFSRNNTSMNASATAVMRPYEKSDIADVQYDWVKFRQGYLRAITRKPKGKTNLPCILLIPGYGCGSVENYMSSYNGKIITEWLKAGYAVVTIEKSGLGDSYNCVPCSEVNLQTDIESFDAGYVYMEQLPFVDKNKLYIWGHSMGGIIAPEVAKRHQPKGVMVFGTTFRPWSEFLLEMHWVQKPLLEHQTYEQTAAFMRTIQKIYYEFFVLKKTREELLKNPEYRELVISELGYKEGNNDMWGRHWAFWPQIDSLNMAQSWQAIQCPVLVLHGAADYESCSIVEPMLITKTVNEKYPGNATMQVIPELDHFMMKSKNWEEARDNFNTQQYNKGNFNFAIAEATINWLKQH